MFLLLHHTQGRRQVEDKPVDRVFSQVLVGFRSAEVVIDEKVYEH